MKTVAVVGSGVSGLGAAWLLHEAGWKVTLYEKEATCGGHTLTDETEPGSPVDLGFQVCPFLFVIPNATDSELLAGF
jgi:phytoene dehydrogenase-like protein